MAEGYTTHKRNEHFVSLKDFEQEQNFNEVLECFYNPKRTGLMCELELSSAGGRNKRNFTLSNEEGYHAEQAFVREARNWFTRSKIDEMKKLSIRMLVSNSPCFSCREDPEHFFIWTKLNIDFTLGVGRLYRNYASEGEIELDYWKNDLEIRNFTVSFHSIDIGREISELQDRVTRYSSTKAKDKKIKELMDSIQSGRSQMKKLIRRDLKLRSHFLEQYFTDVTDGQMMLATIIASGFTETGEKRPTVSNYPFKTDNEEDLIIRINQLPRSWVHIRKTLVLVCARVPSKDCLESITSFLKDKKLEGVENKLVLYIAKVPVNEERREFIKWIHNLEDSSISVCLQPFYGPLEFLTSAKVKSYRILRKNFQKLHRELEIYLTVDESEMTSSEDESNSLISQNESLEDEELEETVSRRGNDHPSVVSSPEAPPLSTDTLLNSPISIDEDSKYDITNSDTPEIINLEESLQSRDTQSDSDSDDLLIEDTENKKFVKPDKR